MLHSIIMEKEVLKKEISFGFNIKRLMKFVKSNEISKIQLFSAFMNEDYKIIHSYLNS